MNYLFEHPGEVAPPAGTPGDTNGDRLANVNDLLTVINTWGPCAVPLNECLSDFNCDGVVNVDDLLVVINNWS